MYYCIIDFETTGLDARECQIIEVAALTTDLETDCSQINFFVRLKKPQDGLPDTIKNLTGITEADLQEGIPEKEAIEILRNFIGDSVVVAHHAPFDLSFLHFVEGESIDPKEFICTRVLAKLLEPDQSAKLKDVCERHGISTEGHHRAMKDVYMTKGVLKKLLPIA